MITKTTLKSTVNATVETKTDLVHAIASALRWYALNENKRNEDNADAAILSDLLRQLSLLEDEE